MALNFSHRPIFPAHRSEENIVQGGGTQDNNKDIRELLPADPFGMDISSTVTAAITGWLEDLGATDYGGGVAEVGKGDYDYDYPLFAGWNFWLNTASMEFGAFSGNTKVDGRMLLRDRNHNDNHNHTRVDGFFPMEEGIQFACTLEGSKCSTTTRSGCFGRVDTHRGNVGGVDGYNRGEEYDGDVRFGCTLEGVKIGGCNASFARVDIGEYGKNAGGGVDGYLQEEEELGCSSEGVKIGACNASFDHYAKNAVVDVDIDGDDDGGPHPALSFALAYLGVRDLLSVERVCKSLRGTVQTDTLLWRSIHIDQPLNERITDDVLLELTNRAQGHLQCLSLVECQRITDDGLKRVLDSNKELTKLSVPGCTRLSIDGVVNCLRSFKPEAVTGIKYLRVGGLFGVTLNHFEELVSLLGIHNQVQADRHKPHFYHRGNLYLSYEDDRPIDIEMCPRCQNLRLVYDCPAEGCQGKDQATQLCRACTLCIARCVQCGKCINDGEYEETFCLELLCSDCWKQVLQCQERQDVGDSHSRHAIPQEPVISFHG